MADGITNQRGAQFDRTQEHTLVESGDQSPPLAAKRITVTVSGDGAFELKVRRHPAVEEFVITPTGRPSLDSPHWADAAPDDPLVGEVAPGAAVVAAYDAAGFAWWSHELVSGGPVTVFTSVDGIALL